MGKHSDQLCLNQEPYIVKTIEREVEECLAPVGQLEEENNGGRHGYR